MPRLQAINPDTATGKAKDLLEGIQSKLGFTPNLARTMANSPAVLQGYLNFAAALGKGTLTPKLREQIALIVGETNDCHYCRAAHTAIAKTVGLSEEAILDSRRGESTDSKVAAALEFSRKLVADRGWVSDEDVRKVRRAGYSDGDIVEIVASVALNMFTNYFNHVAETEVDFPPVPELAAA